MAFLEAHNIWMTYTDMAAPVEVLRGLEFSLEKGEAIGIFGASGTGKSTLLHLLGGLDRPTQGRINAAGFDLSSMSDSELARFRNREVGFVFQFYHLLPEFTALENVMLPPLIAGIGKAEAKRRASEVLEEVGLSDRLLHRPARLSGGEQQRVAIARAAVMKPRIIFADEPTGNLDKDTGQKVWDYLRGLNDNMGISLVAVTHNRDLVYGFSRCLELCDGQLRKFSMLI
ncbi:MAG: ABC transporter ATP-binding protein [Pseudomonadota bacterium]